MSTVSHKGQILPLNNQLIPISKNTTFHASYDGSLMGFNQGKKITPVGHQKSLSFNGTNTYIPINSVCSLMTTTSLTMEAWVRPIDGVTNNRILLGFYTNGGVNLNMLCYEPTMKKFNYYDETSLNKYGNTTLTSGNWYHIAITIDTSNNLMMYLNGNLDITSFTTTVRPATNGWFSIGQDWDPPGLTSDFFRGNIAEARVWNYARSQQEIQDGMQVQLRGDEPGLVGYWKLNEGSGSIVNDSSLYGNDGRVNGTVAWESGRTVATLRPDGKFGGAVAVEDSTSNMLPENARLISDIDSWYCYDGLDVPYHTWGRHIQREFIFNGYLGQNNSLRIYTVGTPGLTTYGIMRDGSISGLADGTSLTWSVVAKGIGTGIGQTLKLHRYSFNESLGVQADQGTYILTNEWRKLSHTWTNRVGDQTTVYLLIDSSDFQFEFSQPQVEQKKFATSFVNGVRGTGFLAYPSSVINPLQGTISFWHKPEFPHTLNTTQAVSPMLFQAGNYYGNSSFSIWNYQNSFNVYVKGTTDTGWSGSGTVLTGVAFPVNIWTMVTVTWNGTVWRMYKDGTYVGTFNTTQQLGALSGNLIYVGGYSGASAGMSNGLITELRIEKVAVADDEITAWYQSNSPFYNYLDYTGVTY